MAISRNWLLYFFLYFLRGVIMANNQQSFMDKLGDTILDSLANFLGVESPRTRQRNIKRIKIGKKHSTLAVQVAAVLNERLDYLRSLGLDQEEINRTSVKYTAFISRLSIYIREQRLSKAARDTWLFYDDLITTTDVFELQETDVDSSVTNISVAIWL